MRAGHSVAQETTSEAQETTSEAIHDIINILSTPSEDILAAQEKNTTPLSRLSSASSPFRPLSRRLQSRNVPHVPSKY